MDAAVRTLDKVNRYLPEPSPRRILVASIPLALACGTLFVYSVYGPQLAEKCGLDSTSAANLNISSTIGTAISGILNGHVTDMLGSQIPTLVSCICLTIGYGWLDALYKGGRNSHLIVLEMAMFFVGFGSTAGYFSSLKALALNFPEFKGSAQSVAIASFAISSMVFLAIATQIFHGDAGNFLSFLSPVCFVLTVFGIIFIRGKTDYVSVNENDNESETINQSTNHNYSDSVDDSVDDSMNNNLHESSNGTLNDLNYTSDTESNLKNVGARLRLMNIKQTLMSGLFWYHYLIFVFLQGFGQMYIYSVGFILKAISLFYGAKDELAGLQAMHVSLIAVASFCGRIAAGPLSDALVRKWNLKRHWNIVFSVVIMFFGHLLLLFSITDMFSELHLVNLYLLMTSVLIGYGYGSSFATFPAIVADIFNLEHYSLIWGIIYSSTIFGLSLMTKIFGLVYDSNSKWINGEHICEKGSSCYDLTFGITSGMCIAVELALLGYIYLGKT